MEVHYGKERPGVRLAFQFIVPSYGWAVGRHEAADTRTRFLVTTASSTLMGVATIAATLGDFEFTAPTFIGAILSLAALLVLSRIAEIRSYIMLMSPKALYEEFIDYPEAKLRERLLYWAGQHYESNRQVVAMKEAYLFCMYILFFTELAYLLLWVAGLVSLSLPRTTWVRFAPFI